MWHVSSRSGVATLRTAIHLLLTYLLTNTPRYPLSSSRPNNKIQMAANEHFQRPVVTVQASHFVTPRMLVRLQYPTLHPSASRTINTGVRILLPQQLRAVSVLLSVADQ